MTSHVISQEEIPDKHLLKEEYLRTSELGPEVSIS